MPYSINPIDSARGMFCRGSGQMLGREVLAAMEPAHANWPGRLDYIIIDLREVEAAISTIDERHRMLDIYVGLSLTFPRVVLVGITSTDLQFGLARMWEQMLQPTRWEIYATRSPLEAITLLQSNLAAHSLAPASGPEISALERA